jgi:hypothetical protein
MFVAPSMGEEGAPDHLPHLPNLTAACYHSLENTHMFVYLYMLVDGPQCVPESLLTTDHTPG